MTPLVVPGPVFDALARAEGLAAGHDVLEAGRRGKRLLLVRELVREAGARLPDRCRRARLPEAYAAVTASQRRARAAVDEVLLHPHVGVWATRTLHALRAGDPVGDADLGRLGAIAAAASVRAGLACQLVTHPTEGLVVLPTLGVVHLPSGTGWCRIHTGARAVELTSADRRRTVALDAPADPGWTPLRRLHATSGGLSLDVELDDVDPLRACGHLVVAGPSGSADRRDWQEMLEEAWALLVAEHRPTAEAVARLVTTIVPLAPSPDAPDLSATCFDALGAVAMTKPRTALNLALALSHEVQHTSLCALTDLVPLLQAGQDELFYAPWRTDPRPLLGVLHGTYAWLGLSGFWEVRLRQALRASPADADLAGFEMALARHQVTTALDALADPARLTPPGRRFVAGMRRRHADLDHLPVSDRARAAAALAAHDHRIAWRLRNVRPHPDAIAALAGDWIANRPARARPAPPVDVVDGDGPLPTLARLSLIRRHLRARPSHDAEDQAALGEADPADAALVAGDLDQAASRYRRRLADAADDPDERAWWTGLALSCRDGDGPAAWALRRHPEIVRAVHRAIHDRSGPGADPDQVAGWVGRVLSG